MISETRFYALSLAIVATAMVLVGLASARAADDEPEPLPPPARTRFQPWQKAWQCNDIRVTVTGARPDAVTYDLGGTIWGGSQFTFSYAFVAGHAGEWLHFNGRPCVPLR